MSLLIMIVQKYRKQEKKGNECMFEADYQAF